MENYSEDEWFAARQTAKDRGEDVENFDLRGVLVPYSEFERIFGGAK